MEFRVRPIWIDRLWGIFTRWNEDFFENRIFPDFRDFWAGGCELVFCQCLASLKKGRTGPGLWWGRSYWSGEPSWWPILANNRSIYIYIWDSIGKNTKAYDNIKWYKQYIRIYTCIYIYISIWTCIIHACIRHVPPAPTPSPTPSPPQPHPKPTSTQSFLIIFHICAFWDLSKKTCAEKTWIWGY